MEFNDSKTKQRNMGSKTNRNCHDTIVKAHHQDQHKSTFLTTCCSLKYENIILYLIWLESLNCYKTKTGTGEEKHWSRFEMISWVTIKVTYTKLDLFSNILHDQHY